LKILLRRKGPTLQLGVPRMIRITGVGVGSLGSEYQLSMLGMRHNGFQVRCRA